jgi:hypothetical protein
MSSSVDLHLAYKFANAPILGFPYPHCYIRDVFPTEFYAELQRNLPDPDAMIPIERVRPVRGYKERFVLEFKPEQLAVLPEPKRRFWSSLGQSMVAGQFGQLALQKFAPFIEARFKDARNMQYSSEAMLVQDVTDYELGPHTDTPKKVITMLFYLPNDESLAHLGTSIYVPKDRNFRCPGTTHHPFEAFERMTTMPFLPNSLFVFVKGDTSFHGVETVGDPGCRRWLLLFDIYAQPQLTQQVPQSPFQVQMRPAPQVNVSPSRPAPAPAGSNPAGSKFSF